MKTNPFQKLLKPKAKASPSENSVSERTVTSNAVDLNEHENETSCQINVVGLYPTPWVFPEKAPQHSMPTGKSFSGNEALPVYSPVSPLSWFFPDCYTPLGILLDISEEEKSLFPLVYSQETMGIQKIYCGLDETGILTAIAWGSNAGKNWEVCLMTDVRTPFSDCVNFSGEGALSTDLANISLVEKRLSNNILMTRAAYGVSSYDVAEDIFSIMMCRISGAISQTTAQIFNSLLTPNVKYLEQQLTPAKEQLMKIDALMNYIICQATHTTTTTNLLMVQNLWDTYMQNARILENARDSFSSLTALNNTYYLKLEMTTLDNTYQLEERVFTRLRLLFELI